MRGFVACCLVFLATSLWAADSTKPAAVIRTEEIASPASPRSLGASLTAARNGALWLSWVEPGRNGMNTLRFSIFDATAKKWRGTRTIASSKTITTNPTDFPQLVVDGTGRATAVWTDGHGGALRSESTDGGAKWSAPSPWTGESTEVEQFSFTTLADGRVLALWLDGRGRKQGGTAQQLYARIVGADGRDMLVDPMVCDCCPTALTAFPDGSALAVYRGRTAEEVRDIRVVRFRGREWDEPRTLNNDDWRINACPVNGPRVASDGGHVAVAWFTKADNDPRIVASYSSDAGARFLMPLRIDSGTPIGNVDTLLLRDGTMLVTWLQQDGSFWLRRINPDFAAGESVALAPGGSGKAKGVPRIALARDYAGGNSAAQLIAAYPSDDATGGLRTLLVTVPEGALLDAEKNCDCAPTAEQLQGYPIRGTITDSLPPPGSLRVQHAELPGIFPEGTREFKVAPEVLAAAQPGLPFVGRVERRDGSWWLFDIRVLSNTK